MSTDPPPSAAGGAPADSSPAEAQPAPDPAAAEVAQPPAVAAATPDAAPAPPASTAPSAPPSLPASASVPTAPSAVSRPPPPPGPPFDASGQARALFSQFDPAGIRPTLIVAGIIVALFFGAQLINAVIPVSATGPGNPGPVGPGPTGPEAIPTLAPGPGDPVSTPLPPGSVMTVGPLRIPIESGWVPQEVPGSNIIVRLVKGGVVMDVFSATLNGQADAATVYNSYIDSMRGQADGLAATQPNQVQVGNGFSGARGTYTGVFGQNQVEGEVTTMVTDPTQGFIFDVWSGTGNLRPLLPEAERMIDNLQVQ